MGNFYLYRIGQFFSLLLPLSWAYALSSCIARIFYFFAAADRKAVHDNLRVIFPEKTDAQLLAIQKAMIRNFAKYLVDFFRFPKIDLAFVEKKVTLKNLHHLRDALAKGKGAILVTAHLGNWELGGAVLGLLKFPILVVALEHKDPRVNHFFITQRQEKGLTVVPLGKAARQCLKKIRENMAIALVGDRDFTNKGTAMDFFGKSALFPEGPAVITLATGAPIIPGFMLRNKDDSFTFSFEPAIEILPTGDKNRDIPAVIKSYIHIFETYIHLYPDQWFMFRKFWINSG